MELAEGEKKPTDEISLEDIDKLLDQEDPNLAKELNEINEAGAVSDVDIESIDIDETQLDSKETAEKKLSRFSQLRKRFFSYLMDRWIFVLARFKILLREVLHFLKVTPIAMAKVLTSWLMAGVRACKERIQYFLSLPRRRKALLIGMVLLSLVFLGSVVLSLRGRWLPLPKRTEVESLVQVGDELVKQATDWISLYSAIRQEPFRFLFSKAVVNLKRTDHDESNNPMVFYEVYVDLDSQETAEEVASREKDLQDAISRVFEEETYWTVKSERGKSRLKLNIQQELNGLIQNGWVSEVYFSNIVLKP